MPARQGNMVPFKHIFLLRQNLFKQESPFVLGEKGMMPYL